MKKLLFAAILLYIAAACQKDPFITLTGSEEIIFTEQGGTQSFSFTVNRDWQISASDSWIHVSPSSGTESKNPIIVNVVCDPNALYDERKATVLITAEGVSQTVYITQEQTDLIQTKNLEYNVPYSGGDITADISTNVEFDISCSETWVSAAQTKALSNIPIKISVQENPTYKERTAGVVLAQKGGGINVTITIKQDSRPPIDLSANETANSYIVPLDDAQYSINASVKGNSSMGITGEKISVIWDVTETGTSVIKEIEYDKDKGVILFFVTGQPGNALVALKDANDIIVWSWHIWATDYKPESNYNTFKGGFVLMQRNLGSLSDDDGGLMYQWGRKEPFVIGKYSTSADYVAVRETNYLVENPTILYDGYINEIPEDYKWATGKTMFDPCPPGWRVAGNYSGEDYVAHFEGRKLIIPEPGSTPQSSFPYNNQVYGWVNNSGVNLWLCSYWRQSNFCNPYYFKYFPENYTGDFQVTFTFNKNNSYDYRTIGKSVRCQRVE